MTLLRRAWLASSRPSAFFARLDDPPALVVAAVVAAVAGLVAALALAAVLARATASTGWLPLLLAVPAVLLPYLALVSLLGGLVLMRPAALDLRAWEIVLWSWAPAGFLALSLLPIGLLAPVPTLVGAGIMLPLWHLWAVWSGTVTHAESGARLAMTLYVAAVFGLPLGLTLFTIAVLSNLAP